ncbi:MarR family winged helix-turn-helix transcriptional regulator [Nocardioides sp. B-3]|uniref:MarR family winged helix-turn-helix transcriptional regulator n=1 Tax=Nocardioides sp. B-3 TaxID=2895565 RepID=UPI00215292E3|nr:MarR family winged helix-turn-helix transcriptional regulator [Nocardioides sp. B-3]UUZ58620.1 MarR family winged helix-turn-helix transcriptional regulator [Nocardioides sp. B-3]
METCRRRWSPPRDRIARGVRAHRQAIATGAGLSPLQADVLRTLAEGPPPEALAGRLATELGVSQPTMSDSLAALEAKGHVRRESLAADRRRTTIALTASGARLAAELCAADETLRARVAELPEQAQERALALLLDLIGGLLDNGILGVARTCPSCRFYEADGDAARCSLLQVSLAPSQLRVNCPEHQPAASAAG